MILPGRMSLLFLEQYSIKQTIGIEKGAGAYQPIIDVPLIVGVGLRFWIELGQECDLNHVDLGTCSTCTVSL